MNIVRFKHIFLSIAAILVVGSMVIIGVKKVTLGAEFTGGSIIGISDSQQNLSEVRSVAKDFDVAVIPVDDAVYELRADAAVFPIDAYTALSDKFFTREMVAYETSIGPSLGKELMRKSIIALVLVLVAILIFIAFAFSGIDDARKKYGLGPSSWMYGLSALLALLHDVVIPTAVFILLGKEITSLFVVGMLSILGLSVSDTIVVFDRIRERMRIAQPGTTFSQLVGQSIRDTFTRSINTSLMLMLTLVALLVFGPAATHDLALVMLLGAFFGTYSSIFVASPFLTLFATKKTK